MEPILIYKASAGSGKTFQLTYHYILMLFESDHKRAHKRIQAVTFTNKATAEMKSRILMELYNLSLPGEHPYRSWLKRDVEGLTDELILERARLLLTDLLVDYSGFRVQTIDGFFQQLIRAFSREIGLQGSYTLQMDTDSVLEEGVDNLLNHLDKQENARLLSWLIGYVEERIDAGSGWNPRADIMKLGNELFKEIYAVHADELEQVLSDETFLVQYRKMLNGQIEVFVKAVEAICNRAMELMQHAGLEVADFNRGERGVANYFRFDTLKNKDFKLTDSFLKAVDDETKWYTSKSPKKEAIIDVCHLGLAACARELSELLAGDDTRWVNYWSSVAIKKHLPTLGILVDIDKQIRQNAKQDNSMLISNGSEFLKRIIDGSETPFIYERTGVSIDHYMIDEFQDTSMMQWNNFVPLLQESVSQGYDNLIVGDVKQSIYRWRNSDWHILNSDVEHQFAGAVQVETLGTNYRSQQQVVEFNNLVFHDLVERLSTEFPGREDEVKQVYSSLEQLPKNSDGRGYVEMNFLEAKSEGEVKEQSLAMMLAQVKQLKEQGYADADIAVLVRTQGEASLVANGLLEEGYEVLSNEGLLIEKSPSVQLILSAMRYLCHPDDVLNRALFLMLYWRYNREKVDSSRLTQVLSTPSDEYQSLEIMLFGEEKGAEFQQIRHFSLFKMTESLVVWLELQHNESDVPFIQAFQDRVHDFANNVSADINEFLNYWEEKGPKSYISASERQNAIRVMTIHKSKGLEFKAVLIPFCNWGFEPGANMNNILWVEPTGEPFNQLPVVPVPYSEKLIHTIFAHDYYNEKLNYFLDTLNVAYVAFTRAEAVLFINACVKSSEKRLSMYGLLQDYALRHEGWDAERSVFAKGRLEAVDKESFEEPIFQTEYASDMIQKVDERLKLRYKTQDYWSVSDSSNLEIKREFGNIMHELLGRIDVKSDAPNAMESMLHDGIITESDVAKVQQYLDAFFNIEETNDWFSGRYRVLKEAEIMTPKGQTFRPDRLMIDGTRVVVVDYKFGDVKDEKYQRQVANYMSLVKKMGYSPEGYLCYVTMNQVEAVVLA